MKARPAIQVLTGKPPFPEAKRSTIDNVVAGTRPHRPPGSNEWLSDGVWNLIRRCWSAFWDGRPDANFVMSALSDAEDVVEFRRREPVLVALLDANQAGVWDDRDTRRAQELVDAVDLVRQFGEKLPWTA